MKIHLSVETVKALAKLREMLNSEEKKKIHTALFDPEDKIDCKTRRWKSLRAAP